MFSADTDGTLSLIAPELLSLFCMESLKKKIKYTFNSLTIQKCVVYSSLKVTKASPQACKVQKIKQKYMGGVHVGEGVSAKKKK